MNFLPLLLRTRLFLLLSRIELLSYHGCELLDGVALANYVGRVRLHLQVTPDLPHLLQDKVGRTEGKNTLAKLE